MNLISLNDYIANLLNNGFFCKIVIKCKFLVIKCFSITIGEKILIFLFKKDTFIIVMQKKTIF